MAAGVERMQVGVVEEGAGILLSPPPVTPKVEDGANKPSLHSPSSSLNEAVSRAGGVNSVDEREGFKPASYEPENNNKIKDDYQQPKSGGLGSLLLSRGASTTKKADQKKEEEMKEMDDAGAGSGGANHAPFLGSVEMEKHEDFFSSSVLQNRSHQQLTGVPYCSVCKKYLEKSTKKEDILQEGYLGKKKNMLQMRMTRWFVFAESHLIYYYNQEDVGRTFPQGVIHLDGCIVADTNANDLHFTIKRMGKTVHLRAPTISEKKAWVKAIRESDFTYNNVRGDALAAMVDKGFFCEQCKKYVNLDDFNLAEIDGKIEKYQFKKRSWAKRWVAVVKDHIAYYDDEEAVKQYRPSKVLHLKDGRVVKANSADVPKDRKFILEVQTDERAFWFALPTEESLNEWLEVMKSCCSS